MLIEETGALRKELLSFETSSLRYRCSTRPKNRSKVETVKPAICYPWLIVLVVVTVTSCSTVEQPTKGRQLVQGMTFYESLEPLTGKLLFLVDTNRISLWDIRSGRGETAAVYEFNLSDYAIRKVTSAPSGGFVPSLQGDALVVIWAEYNPTAETHDIKAWGFSEHTQHGKSVTLYSDDGSSMPGATVVIGESAFFDVWSRSGGAPGILRFNFSTGEKTFLNLPRGVSPYPHQAEDNTNVLHVQGDGNSWYGFDIRTGQIAPVNCTKECCQFRCADGSYVFFEGSGAPINGFTLVSSPANSFSTQLGDVDRKRVRVLKRFSRLSGGYYSLNALSPCRRYALVCHNETGLDGWIRTYYVINVSTGNSWILMKDEVSRKTGGEVSEVWWLNKPPANAPDSL